jgi:hypothetical protein
MVRGKRRRVLGMNPSTLLSRMEKLGVVKEGGSHLLGTANSLACGPEPVEQHRDDSVLIHGDVKHLLNQQVGRLSPPDEVEAVGEGLVAGAGQVNVDMVLGGSGLVPDPPGDGANGGGALVVDDEVSVLGSLSVKGQVLDELLPDVKLENLARTRVEREDRLVNVCLRGSGRRAQELTRLLLTHV